MTQFAKCWFVVESVAAICFAVAVGAVAVRAAESAPIAPRERIQQLIESLGDDAYEVRQRAQEELIRIGFEAYDQLVQATEHEDLEIASRCRYLVRLIEIEWTRDDDPEPVKELLKDYESADFSDRAERVQRLAYLPDGMGVAALCRVVRFEPSELLSKFAASELLNQEPPGQAGQARWAKTLRENLGRKPQKAAKWLSEYLHLRENPADAVAGWAELVAAEKEAVQETPSRSDPLIVSTLLYRLAAAQADLGDGEAAEKTAAEAREVYPVGRETQQRAHLQTALVLQRQGRIVWAAREYELVSQSGWSASARSARMRHAEMLHDQGNDLEAAEVLKKLVVPEDERIRLVLEKQQEILQETRARMEYFYANHWKAQGDQAKHRQHLDKALEADPLELDTLITCYQLPEQTPEYRAKIVRLIEEAAKNLQKEIEEGEGPYTKANRYNQYAWLVGNTEGNVDLALEYAHQAVQIMPDSGAYLDTLAHVYFGKGDYASAVKYQSEALEADPHSGLLKRKLDRFRKALEAQQKTEDRRDDTERSEVRGVNDQPG
jgi:hypothetical protein